MCLFVYHFLQKEDMYKYSLLYFIFLGIVFSNFNVERKSIDEDLISNIDSTVTITIAAVGDLMCHSTQYNYARIDSDSFDFSPVYREIKNYFSQFDFVIGNLETVIAGKEKGFSGYPFFNSPDEYVAALKDAGFNLLITANNHSLDKGESGLLRTIEQIKKNELHYSGTFVSQEDRDSLRIYDVNGITIGILSYSYGTNGLPIPNGKDYLINLIDNSLIENDIRALRETNVDIVLVYYHFGEEYKRFPNIFQKNVVEHTFQAGADIIIGSHPHVIQPVEYLPATTGNLDTGFVAYSLGNFISNQQWRYSDAGVILSISITKNIITDSLYISDVSYLPTWVFRGSTERGREYIILPSEIAFSDSLPSYLSKNDIDKMREAFDDTKEILTSYTNRINIIQLKSEINTK